MQADLASEHKGIDLEIGTGLKDAGLRHVLSRVLDDADRGDQPKFFDAHWEGARWGERNGDGSQP